MPMRKGKRIRTIQDLQRIGKYRIRQLVPIIRDRLKKVPNVKILTHEKARTVYIINFFSLLLFL